MINKEKLFNLSIVAGMTIAVAITTAIKLSNAQGGEVAMIIAAVGSITGILCSVLSANAKVATFFFGILDVTIYGVMCILSWKNGGSGLGNGLLHILYFLPMQFVGMAQWRKLGASATKKSSVKARRLNSRQWKIYSAAFLGLVAVCYLALLRFDRSGADSFWKLAVLLDVIPLACNLLGQFLLSNAYREQWIFWIGVNVFSVLMWINTYKECADAYALVYIIKYVFYLVNSVNGLRVWTNLTNLQKQ